MMKQVHPQGHQQWHSAKVKLISMGRSRLYDCQSSVEKLTQEVEITQPGPFPPPFRKVPMWAGQQASSRCLRNQG